MVAGRSMPFPGVPHQFPADGEVEDLNSVTLSLEDRECQVEFKRHGTEHGKGDLQRPVPTRRFSSG